MKKKKAIVCRCEDITEEDVINAIKQGYTDIEELRKKLRIGMGPCQGRVCIQIVRKILKNYTKKDISKIPLPKSRPPIIPVTLGTLSSDKDEKKS